MARSRIFITLFNVTSTQQAILLLPLSDKILNEGITARESYIRFLKSGESDDPIPLLKLAGVDMSKAEPIEKAMETFEALLDELEGML